VFPVHEYWVDIGQHSDLARADADFGRLFDIRSNLQPGEVK
jgi:hypothetical protein